MKTMMLDDAGSWLLSSNGDNDAGSRLLGSNGDNGAGPWLPKKTMKTMMFDQRPQTTIEKQIFTTKEKEKRWEFDFQK